MNQFSFTHVRVACFVLLNLLVFAGSSYAKSAAEIDASVDAALGRFQEEVYGAQDMLADAKGVLILPGVLKAGIGFGGEYGVGALRVNGKSVDYYNIISGSIGFQLGIQAKDVYLLFMEQSALDTFRASEGWQAGVNGSITLIKIGADAQVDTTRTNEPILAFVIGQKGLMYNLNLEGSKFNKILPS